MSYTMADWRRDYITEHLKDLPAAEERSGGRLYKAYRPKNLFEALSPEQLGRLRKKLQSEPAGRPRKPRRKT